jgi:hypothetical protein
MQRFLHAVSMRTAAKKTTGNFPFISGHFDSGGKVNKNVVKELNLFHAVAPDPPFVAVRELHLEELAKLLFNAHRGTGVDYEELAAALTRSAPAGDNAACHDSLPVVVCQRVIS